MLCRRVDDRIRQLSDQIVHASNEELSVLLPALLNEIHQKLERFRAVAANRFLVGQTLAERRILTP